MWKCGNVEMKMPFRLGGLYADEIPGLEMRNQKPEMRTCTLNNSPLNIGTDLT